MATIPLFSETKEITVEELLFFYINELEKGHLLPMCQTLVRASKRISTATDSVQKADAYRDKTLLNLAWADSLGTLDADAAEVMFDGTSGITACLEYAEKLDRNNPDNSRLARIKDKISTVYALTN